MRAGGRREDIWRTKKAVVVMELLRGTRRNCAVAGNRTSALTRRADPLIALDMFTYQSVDIAKLDRDYGFYVCISRPSLKATGAACGESEK